MMKELRKKIANKSDKLYRYVDRLFYSEGLSAAKGKVIVPHPNCHLIINLTDTPVDTYYLNHKGDSIAKISAFSKIYHLHTKPVSFGELDENDSIGVYFKPFALSAFTQIPPMVNKIISAEGIFSNVAQLRKILMQAPSANRLAILEAYLNDIITPLPESDLGRLEAIHDMFTGNRGLAEIAQNTHLSKRSLHTLVKKYTGLTPKSLSHIYVISQFIELINHSPHPINWQGVATELGFYDQSHFIKLFKSFTGLTPTEWLSTIKLTGKPADEWVHADLTAKV